MKSELIITIRQIQPVFFYIHLLRLVYRVVIGAFYIFICPIWKTVIVGQPEWLATNMSPTSLTVLLVWHPNLIILVNEKTCRSQQNIQLAKSCFIIR